MKNAIMCAAALLAVASPSLAAPAKKAAAKPAAARPFFDFKGVTAGAKVDTNIVVRCGPVDGEGVQSCSARDKMLAGIELTSAPGMKFYNGRLSDVVAIFNSGEFVTVLSAFSQKYGKPCKTERPKWQSKAGAVFDNTVVTWCFRTGTLELAQMSVDRDYGHVMYVDDHQPPVKAAPVDF